MTMDFMERLQEYTNRLGLPLRCKQGALEAEDAFVLYPLPGGQTVKAYYDGITDRELYFEYAVKTKDNAGNYKFLIDLGKDLEALGDLPSGNGSYDFQRIEMASAPSLTSFDDRGHMIYTMSIKVNLTIY